MIGKFCIKLPGNYVVASGSDETTVFYVARMYKDDTYTLWYCNDENILINNGSGRAEQLKEISIKRLVILIGLREYKKLIQLINAELKTK